jgi:hypothetical protein
VSIQLTEDEQIALAEMLHESKKQNGGKAKRSQVIKDFKDQFNKDLTPGILANLYDKYVPKDKKKESSPQQSFITCMFRLKLKRAKTAPVVPVIEPVNDVPASRIEKPPKTTRKKIMAVQKPEPILAPVEIPESPTPEPEPITEDVPPAPKPVSVTPTRKPPTTRLKTKVLTDEDPQELARQTKITEEEGVTIAQAFIDWDPDVHSGSPFGLAALTINGQRREENRPLATAELVRTHILGSKKNEDLKKSVTVFLSKMPISQEVPGRIAQAAERVAAYKPRPHL